MRFIKAIVISMVLSIPMSLTVFAGVWRTGEGVNKDRWWYDNGDGTYANNGWYWIDNGNVEKCYYFDENGWLLTTAITPDGYEVNDHGKWVVTQTANQYLDYKGNYQLKGEEYIWVDKYYMKDSALYIEGTYCDGIYNPNADCEADTVTFAAIKENVTVIIDDTTKIAEVGETIDNLKEHIDTMIYYFNNIAIWLQLDGNHVVEVKGTWQYS